MSTNENYSETPIAEADLAKKIGVSKDILKEFRRQKLLKGEHFYAQQGKPIEYTTEGVYAAAEHFIGITVTEVPKIPTMQELLKGQPLTPEDMIPEPGHEVTARPIVERLAINPHILLCTVGPHRNVRVWVKSSANYIPRMVVPIDVDLVTLDPAALIDYGGKFQGRDPLRRGWWGVKL